MTDFADAARTRRLRALLTLTDNILARAEAGHRQSIGSIDNVRMVQFGVDELQGYRAELERQSAAVLDTEGDRQATSPDDVMDVYVPGNWTCPKCSFSLSQSTIFMGSGEIGCTREQVMAMSGEVCPNDGEPMRRTTWHERAEENRKWGESLMEDIIAATGAEHLPGALETARKNCRDIHAYRGALGYAVPGWHDGKLSDGTEPKCGMCDARARRADTEGDRPVDVICPACRSLGITTGDDTTWHDAALRVGEMLAPDGPLGYYEFAPMDWLSWATGVIKPVDPLADTEGDQPTPPQEKNS